MTGAFFITIAVAEGTLVVAMFLCFIRLVRGPSFPDRVVALDLMSGLVAGIIGLDAIATNQTVFLRSAIVIAMLSFLGTVAYANYIGKGGKP